MPRPSSSWKPWLPALLWMAVIFASSCDVGSSRHTTHYLGPFLHWLFPRLTEEDAAQIVFEIRKTAHVMEYTILVILLWRAIRQPMKNDPRAWSWRDARLALLLAASYAATDEFHQTFVPSREGCVRDVALDTAGAASALLVLWAVGRWRRRW